MCGDIVTVTIHIHELYICNYVDITHNSDKMVLQKQ